MTKSENDLVASLAEIDSSFQLSDMQLQQLRIFYENLIKWNEVMNLTTITEENDVYVKHFLDSLSLLKVMTEDDLSGKKLIDVGTGAGFPGLVLAIAFPKLNVTLMDSLNKRISFLQDTVDKLDVHNVTCIHARAEELARNKQYREKFDLVVSRAVANIATLSEYDLPFVKVGGTFVAYKSEKAEEELKTAGKAIEILGGELTKAEKFTLPGTDYERCLLVIDKRKPTAGKYPRKAGTPSKEPLH